MISLILLKQTEGKTSFSNAKIDHQGSYKDDKIRLSVLFSIIKENEIKPRFS